MKSTLKLSALTLALFTAMPAISVAGDCPLPGTAIYTLHNDSKGNEILGFSCTKNGDFNQFKVATNGTGTDLDSAYLVSSGALALSTNEKYLFAVNPGSNSLSAFLITENGLELLDVEPEPGVRPVSVTFHDNVLYVGNSGDNSIVGFKFSPANGSLSVLPNSYRKISPRTENKGLIEYSSDPLDIAQISFSSDGNTLVISQRKVNRISTVMLDADKIPANIVFSTTSSDPSPFGFAFAKRDVLLVTHEYLDTEGKNTPNSSAGTYKLDPVTGQLNKISGALASGQTATCWTASTPDGQVFYATSPLTSAISSYNVGFDGSLTLRQSKAASTDPVPSDVAIANGRTLFTINSSNNIDKLGKSSISVFHINDDFTLAPIGTLSNLPINLMGLVAR